MRGRGLRGRLAVLCALLALPLAAPVAHAGPEPGTFLVRGEGGTTTTLLLTQPLFFSPPVPEVVSDSAFAGLLVEPLDRPAEPGDVMAALRVDVFGDRTGGEAVPAEITQRLGPGRYRVTLLGRGPVEVRYSLGSPHDPGVLVRPSRRVPQRLVTRTVPLDGPTVSARVALPSALPAGRRAVQVLLLDGTAVEDVRTCATTGTTCPGLRPVGCVDDVCPELPNLATTTSTPTGFGAASLPARGPRTLLWTVEGVRTTADRLRAAAVVFP